MPTFAEYLDKWLKQSTASGLNNPLVKMPVKRFRPLQTSEFDSIINGGSLAIGTLSDPIARNLYRNFKARIDERGEHCGFVCCGSVEVVIAGAVGQQPRTALFPVCLKRAALHNNGNLVRVNVADDEEWQFNPVLKARLATDFAIHVTPTLHEDPALAVNWLRAQLGNRATVKSESHVGLFSSQEMVVQQRLAEPPLRQALAANHVVRSKIEGTRVGTVDLGPAITDEGMEELGLVLPCDDSQLRVIQLSNKGCSLQVEGPPGTGKSQTIANIIGNALYHGRTALLVCDKKEAIAQVKKRLADCGLSPALLNLHDEDLDKREFLKQATDRFAQGVVPANYPLDDLRETRKTLNDRVKFGRAIAHASLQVTRREALAGLIRLRKEIKHVPVVPIPNWEALSKERLAKLLKSVREWPGLASVLTNQDNVWNAVLPDAFDENPNAANEIAGIVTQTLQHLESLDEVREWVATVGVESGLRSDHEVKDVLTLANTVLQKPACHPKVIGNNDLGLRELERLKLEWDMRQQLREADHPIPLDQVYSPETEREATDLLASEAAISWHDLSRREAFNSECCSKIRLTQLSYKHLCDQIGLIYSPELKVRRSQLQVVTALGRIAMPVPGAWWDALVSPTLLVGGWVAKLKACINHVKSAPFPSDLVALDRVAATHWLHVEAMAEHGFNKVSYCLKFVNDRKCKYALRQAYPSIPLRGFKQWREITLHAVAAKSMVESVRLAAAESHVVFKQVTETFLALTNGAGEQMTGFLENEDVSKKIESLKSAAAIVEQWRGRDDLFDVKGSHWRTFWESPSHNLLNDVKRLQVEFDSLVFPSEHRDNVEEAICFFDLSSRRILTFLKTYETKQGDRQQSVMEGMKAQQTFAVCEERLTALAKYMELQQNGENEPKWDRLREILAWRDLFDRLRGCQKLDIDSRLWLILRDRLKDHAEFMVAAKASRERFFQDCLPDDESYDSLKSLLIQIAQELPNRQLWLEKERWRRKIPAFPEFKSLWDKVLNGSVPVGHAEQLFCFNILRLCDPIAKPHGPELKGILDSFTRMDEKLTMWVIDHMKDRLKKEMQRATSAHAGSAAELSRLSGLQRIRGSVRALVNAHLEYILAAKPCWMMSPTSLANLVDTKIFEQHGVPFDLVIFDEASQIRVLDGLLSMAFGKQAIIVGDRNQLPPTNFFAGFANPTDDDNGDFGDSESLLDEFGGVFEEDVSRVMLLSHYRSETPDLIRFSNDWFYSKTPGELGSGRLEMFPPARISGIGRRFHHVPNAIYSEKAGGRTNPVEASEVFGLIQLHVRDYPDKSLGVVTMNIPQMEVIDELIQQAAIPEIQAFCADESKFFLRNLETVQGNEMDRIILSLTYGKNIDGKFNAAVLGPLTKSGGHRRLNVAISRAKNGMVVVSSLKTSDLSGSSADSEGFRCLKALLMDLENAEQNHNFGIGSERFKRKTDGVSSTVFCESPFEEQVVEFLENAGYEIECQYGAGKFRLDIVVKERGKNLLAIECDGAAYHSSLVARTRDRARQRILEKVGWRFHRVWSTNWWFFEDQEKDGIVAAINAARSAANSRGH